MATRRSRIKAVANLPARRGRPSTSNDVKADIFDKSGVAASSNQSETIQDVSSVNVVGQPKNGKDGNPCSDPSEDTQVPPDRKSVIVSVEKDRKSVIVNRDNCVTISELPSSETREEDAVDKKQRVQSTQEDISSEYPSKNLKESQYVDAEAHLECTEATGPKRKSSVTGNSPLESQPDSSKDMLQECQQSRGQINPKECSSDLNERINSDQSYLKCDSNGTAVTVGDSEPASSTVLVPAHSNCDPNSSVNKRIPLRSRRSRPTVNLTAAARKRPSNDSSIPTPCSPPPKKSKCLELLHPRNSESENNNVPEPHATLDNETGHKKTSDSALPNLFKNQTDKLLPCDSETIERESSDPPGVFKTPVSSISRKRDVVAGPPTDSGKTDGCTASPVRESNSTKRKQSTNAQRVAAARKTLKTRLNSDGAPPRAALTMFDLIFYNPSKNPMKSSDTSPTSKRRRVDSVSSVSSIHEERLDEESVDDVDVEKSKEDTEEETAMPVPQVKVGPDGSLILDEKSLVIETTGAKKSREELEKSGVIVDTKSSYGHYKKVVRSKDWSDHETKKFYRALNVVGTDFSLMKPYFRKRSRRELKLKFKKEERLNPNLINKALGEPLDFDISELEKECELEDEEEKRLEEMDKEKPSPKLTETANDIEGKGKKVPKKKKGKRSALFAEMEEELEDTPPGKKSIRHVPVKKGTQIPDPHAEADYNILAVGVQLQEKEARKSSGKNPEPQTDQNQEPKTKACSRTARSAKLLKQPPATQKASLSEKSVKAPGITPLVSNSGAPKETPSVSSSSAPMPTTKVNVVPSSTSPTALSNSSAANPTHSIFSSPSASSPVTLTIPPSPQPQIQIIPINASKTLSLSVGAGTNTPRTIKIVRGQTLSPQTFVMSGSQVTNRALSCELSASTPSVSTSQSNLLPTSIPSPVIASGSKVTGSSPISRVRAVHVTPQSGANVPNFGLTTPVSRLLPSTPALPRMEPGSIIVLKTPLPQNPDRHVLQVYMVTNTPPGATSTPLPLSPSVPGLNLLSGPVIQPASNRSPFVPDESDSEKVLTKL